jgi:hypothetical protein
LGIKKLSLVPRNENPTKKQNWFLNCWEKERERERERGGNISALFSDDDEYYKHTRCTSVPPTHETHNAVLTRKSSMTLTVDDAPEESVMKVKRGRRFYTAGRWKLSRATWKVLVSKQTYACTA